MTLIQHCSMTLKNSKQRKHDSNATSFQYVFPPFSTPNHKFDSEEIRIFKLLHGQKQARRKLCIEVSAAGSTTSYWLYESIIEPVRGCRASISNSLLVVNRSIQHSSWLLNLPSCWQWSNQTEQSNGLTAGGLRPSHMAVLGLAGQCDCTNGGSYAKMAEYCWPSCLDQETTMAPACSAP